MFGVRPVLSSAVLMTAFLSAYPNQTDRRGTEWESGESTLSPVLQIPSPFTGCHQRSVCGSSEKSSSSSSSAQWDITGGSRNCFCDDLCSIYDDCCDDLRSESISRSSSSTTNRSLRSYASCQRLPNNDQGGTNTSELYIITRCSINYEDSYVRERCEKPTTVTTSGSPDDRFYRLPVLGGPPFYLLYRNAYCAICSGEGEFVFWSAVMRCGVPQPSQTAVNSSNILRNFIRDAPTCSTSFVPSRESLQRPAPRSCKVSIGRCDRSWTDRTIARKCRERTDFVFAGTRTFRNRECAVCNYVNETYLRCEENRSPPPEGDGKIVIEEPFSYSVSLDFNRRRAAVSFPGDKRADTTIIFTECFEGKVYDPFADQCRLVSCRHGYSRREELCVQASKDRENSTSNSIDLLSHRRPKLDEENYDDDDDEYPINVPEVTSESSSSNQQCSLVTMNATSVLRLDNGSVYITHLQRILASDQLIWQGSTVHMCVPETQPTGNSHAADRMFLSPRYNFTMFQFEPWQRSLSLVGAVICLVAIFVQLLIYAMFTSLWSTTDGKSVLCLSLSLFLAQLLYLFAILVWEELPAPTVCFVISEVMQYFFLAAFCWLNVVSIDVFRWLKSSDSSSTYSYIAEECCTRFVWYSIYAWTVPLIVVTGSTVTVLLRIDGWYPSEEHRVGGCWMVGLSQLMLFTLPICLLLIVNGVLYVIAVCKFCLEVFPARFEQQRHKYKHRCIVSLQLSVLMGMTWLFAVTAAVTRRTFLWTLFIVFDALQGVFLCSAFVCTRKVWRLFCSKGRIRRLSDGHGVAGRRSKSGPSRTKSSPLKSSRNRVIMLETSI